MQVTFRKESWHFKYYEFMTGFSTQPKTLCPYFWSLIGITALSPLFLIAKTISFLQEKLDNWALKKAKNHPSRDWTPEQWTQYQHDVEQRLEKIKKKNSRIEKAGKIVLYAALFSMLLMVIHGVIVLVGKWGWTKFLVILVSIVSILATIVGIVMFFLIKGGDVRKWIKNSFIFNFFGGMIAGAYQKACPIIVWKSETNKTA
jgi:hypothetical protein